MTQFDNAIEKLMSHFTQGPYADEVLDAKQTFFKSAGIFDEESPDFEQKMAQFSDYYIFSRKLEREGMPPIQIVAEGQAFDVPVEEQDLYQRLARNHHSLFELIKVKAPDIHIKDIFSNEKITIKDSPLLEGFTKGEIFEARLIPVDDSFLFSGSFCFHPPKASRFIYKEIKKIQKMEESERADAQEALIQRLFRMRYKFEQYQHVELSQIYSNESKLRL